MGVVHSRQGSGTYLADGPPRLKSEPLEYLVDLHGLTLQGLFEARQALETAVAGYAAERATPEDIQTMEAEIGGMVAASNDPEVFLGHDAGFHRAVAQASHNPILASVVEMISQAYYGKRRIDARRSHDLGESAEEHRRISSAIGAHDPDAARFAMREHLDHALIELEREKAEVAR
jgi:GntR family transcriptional repressor for pyruvate dehydrogenase complex